MELTEGVNTANRGRETALGFEFFCLGILVLDETFVFPCEGNSNGFKLKTKIFSNKNCKSAIIFFNGKSKDLSNNLIYSEHKTYPE